jgi:hypothetical protein
MGILKSWFVSEEKKVEHVISSLTNIVEDLETISKNKEQQIVDYVNKIADINKLKEEAAIERQRAATISTNIANLLKG